MSITLYMAMFLYYMLLNIIVCKFLLSQELNQRAQGEVTIRDALRELDLWGAGAVFQLTEYEDSQKNTIQLIKDWKDLFNEVKLITECFIFILQ